MSGGLVDVSHEGGTAADAERESLLAALRQELKDTRERRFRYQMLKLSAVGATLGAGALLFEKMNTVLVFYAVPFLAVTIDLFISGESFTMRRLASFIEQRSSGPGAEWEEFVRHNPDQLARWANLLATGVASCGSVGLLFATARVRHTSLIGPTVMFMVCALLIRLDAHIFQRIGAIGFLQPGGGTEHASRVPTTAKERSAG